LKPFLLPLALLLGAAPLRAEIALFPGGTTLKVSSHSETGETLRLRLQGGGELELPREAVMALLPDEVVEVDSLGGDLRSLVKQIAEHYGLPPQLVLAVVMVESGFHPEAVSRKGAQGLMQLMPTTAASLGVDHPFDPAQNVDGGVRHLQGLLTAFGGDLRKALAAYNAGAEAVRRHGGVPPFPETQAYVRAVLRLLPKAP
jgi:soluble lytic murein transglycosylase-like protein